MEWAGGVLFVVVVAALFLVTFALSSRYGRGLDRKRVREITREIGLRDGNLGVRTGLPPYPDFGNDDASPRERVRRPPESG